MHNEKERIVLRILWTYSKISFFFFWESKAEIMKSSIIFFSRQISITGVIKLNIISDVGTCSTHMELEEQMSNLVGNVECKLQLLQPIH
jgi:hypothetical protein